MIKCFEVKKSHVFINLNHISNIKNPKYESGCSAFHKLEILTFDIYNRRVQVNAGVTI